MKNLSNESTPPPPTVWVAFPVILHLLLRLFSNLVQKREGSNTGLAEAQDGHTFDVLLRLKPHDWRLFSSATSCCLDCKI